MRRFSPVLVLLVLAPAVAEFLIGNVPATVPMHLALDVGLYGAGAVLVRELARRRGLGWPAILLLGAGFAVVLEGLLLETIFNPDFPVRGGRALGVNWIYAEWAVGYHAVWSIVIPILLTELLFPGRRTEPWLGDRELAAVGSVLVVACLAMALRFRFDFASYTASGTQLAAAAAVALALAALGLVWRAPTSRVTPGSPARRAPSFWPLRLMAGFAGVVWFGFDLYGAVGRGIPAPVVMLAGALLAGLMTFLLERWSAAERVWGGAHQLALVAGALTASLLFGLLVSATRGGSALVVQLLVTGIAIVLLVRSSLASSAAESAVAAGSSMR
jgi:hypothetical protein